MCSEPCFSIFDPEKETIIQTDASLEGLGAILKQKQIGEFESLFFKKKKKKKN